VEGGNPYGNLDKSALLEGGNPSGNLDKNALLLEASSLFNETSLNTRKCTFCLGKILVLLNQVSRLENSLNY
jgi:hypothetical protein